MVLYWLLYYLFKRLFQNHLNRKTVTSSEDSLYAQALSKTKSDSLREHFQKYGNLPKTLIFDIILTLPIKMPTGHSP